MGQIIQGGVRMNKEVAITITLKEYEELSITKKKYEKLKEVINKAMEFTNKNWGTWCTHHLEYMTELQDILKGSDSNE